MNDADTPPPEGGEEVETRLVALLLAGEQDEVVTAVTSMFDRPADDPDVWRYLGALYLNQLGQPEPAVDCYRHALQLSPTLSTAYVELAVALYRQGRLFDSREILFRLLRFDPESAAARENIEALESVIGDAETEIAAMQDALSSGSFGEAREKAAAVIARISDHPDATAIDACANLLDEDRSTLRSRAACELALAPAHRLWTALLTLCDLLDELSAHGTFSPEQRRCLLDIAKTTALGSDLTQALYDQALPFLAFGWENALRDCLLRLASDSRADRLHCTVLPDAEMPRPLRRNPLGFYCCSNRSEAGHDDLSHLLKRFETCFAALDFGLAADAAEEAFEMYPASAYRFFVNEQNRPLMSTLAVTGRLDNFARNLDRWFPHITGLNLACADEPEVIKRNLRRREELIQSGLPPALLVTQMKSGSVTLATVFSEGFALPCFTYALIYERVIESWARDYALGGTSYVTHLKPTPANIATLKRAGIKRLIVHIRDPRQTLISYVHHIARYAHDFPELNNDAYRRLSLIEKIDLALPYFHETVAWIEGWLAAENDLDILFSTFEDFRREPNTLIDRYLEHYGGDLRHFSRDRVFVEHEGTDYHRRLGHIDEWRRQLTPAQIEKVEAGLPSKLRGRFGWH